MKRFSSLLLLACIMCLHMVLPGSSITRPYNINYIAGVTYYNPNDWQHLLEIKIDGFGYNDYNNNHYGVNCYMFVKKVLADRNGVTLPIYYKGSDHFGCYYPGYDDKIVVQYLSRNGITPSAAKLQEMFLQAKQQDVVQLYWDNTQHTALVSGIVDDGAWFFEANVAYKDLPSEYIINGERVSNINNHKYTWAQLEKAFSKAGNLGGLTIYRFVNSGSSPIPTPPPSPQTITITTDSTLPSTTKDTYFDKQLECSASGSLHWEIIGGNRPDGIDVDPVSGLLRGKSQRTGTFTFTVEVRSGSGVGTKQFTLTVNEPNSSPAPTPSPQTITITTDSALPSTTKDTYFDKLLECTGTGQTSWQVISGTCPRDITLNQFSGRLEGYPRTAGTFAFTVEARNNSGSGTKTFTLTVNDPDRLIITTDHTLPSDNKGSGYDFHFSTNKGSARWELIGGSLPPGIKLDEGSGHLYSTFEQAGTYTFRLRASNDYGTDEKEFTITVRDPNKLTITTDSVLPSDTKGAGYDFHFSTNKGSARWELIGGSLPPGIKLDEGSGHLYSTFEQAGTYTFRLRASNDYGTDEKDFTITVKEPPITYATTRWELSGNQLVIEYKASSGNTSTAKFQLTASDGDNRYIITGLPANTTVNLPANWIIDTDERTVTVSDASKAAKLADEYGVRILGAASVKVNYDGITLTARKIQNVTRWEVSGNDLVVECSGEVYSFPQYNADGDKYFIVKDIPNGAVITLPENWTADTDGRAVTVSDTSKVASLTVAGGVRVSGACTIMVNYAGITFVARQVSSGSAETQPETYTTTRWEVSGSQLIVEYKSSSGTTSTQSFSLQASDGDSCFIVSGLPANITIDLPENWAVDTDGRAVTVSDASKVSRLAPADGVRITGTCTINVDYDGITFTARQIQNTTRWEVSGNELAVECSGKTHTFTKYSADGDEYFIVEGLPNGAVIELPAGWTVDTDVRAVTVSDESKVSRLADEYGVRISGACRIMVNYSGITFVARQTTSTYRESYAVTRWDVVNNELVIEYKASSGTESTARFTLQTLNGDNMYIISGLPANITINLPEGWTVDTDGRAVTVSDTSKVSSLADEYGVRIAGPCAITVNYSGITLTARRVQAVTRWELVGNELVLEYSGNTYTFQQSDINGDKCFMVEGLPNGAVINLPEGWTVDTDGRAVTVSDNYKLSPLSDEYGVRITGPCTITVNYSGITLTARRVQAVTRWELVGNELALEYSGNTYTFQQSDINGDKCFMVEGLPNGAVINLPEGWTVDTDGRAVTVSDNYKLSPLSDEYGVRITGPCTITVIYSGITFTVRSHTAVTQEQPKFRTHSLLLSGQIGVNFYVDLPEISGVDYMSSYVDFDIAGDKANPEQMYDPEFMNKKKTYYGFRCYIKSIQMADPITAVLHYGDQTVTHEYSAKKYLDDSLAADIPDVERSLIEAIKDFGHYAQLYLSRVNGWSLGTAHEAIDCENEYSDSDIEAARQAVDSNAVVKDIPEDSGIKRIGFSLNLDADTTINLYIYPEDDYTGSIAAYIPGSSTNDAVYYADRNRYKVEISNIPAHRLAETFTVKVIGKKEFDVKVSAFSYVYAALNDANAKDDEIDTVVSLYRYYTTNMDYRAANGL